MIEHFKRLYASMDTEELIDLQRKGSLREEAQEILNNVLESRGVTTKERGEIAAELEATSYDDQVKHFAPVGSRIMARVIDTMICFAIAGIIGFILHLFRAALSVEWLLLVPIGFFGYFLFADCMQGGQSFGKKWNNISVVNKTTHAQCTCLQSLFRNLFLVAFGIIDVALVLGNRQRAGDRIAGTQVVRAVYLDKPRS